MFYRRRHQERDFLIRAGRQALIQHETDDSTHVLATWTPQIISVHYGISSGGTRFQETRRAGFVIAEYPGLLSIHDGTGWNLIELLNLLEELP
jgi:hypothetical protein